MPGRNSIVLKGQFLRKEAKATVAVKPGMLVQWDTNYDTVKPCVAIAGAVPGGASRKAFALENDLVGQGVGTSPATADAYDINDTVQYGIFHRGAEIQALLATGNNAAIGAPLVSNGAGNLKLAATTQGADDEEILGYAAEALNNATGSDQYIRMEVA